MTRTEALLILNAIPGFGNSRIRRLIQHYGPPEHLLTIFAHQLKNDMSLPDDVVSEWKRFPRDEFLRREYTFMHDMGVSAVVDGDGSYPEWLAKIPDAPVVLYVQGRWPLSLPAVGMVGSRRASIYGLESAQKLAVRLAECGLAVVSGLARGIDTAAHNGCLKAGGVTAAVLGSGLARIYPSENERLVERIVRNGGVVISEFPMKTEPRAFNFPRRNRIISGLSLGVIVVEAACRSGALITADFALEQGREVFAVPGPIGSPFSRGTHELIKNGAKLAACAEDVLEELKRPLAEFVAKDIDEVPSLIYKESSIASETAVFKSLPPPEILILKILGSAAKHADQVVEESALAPAEASVILLTLEMKGLVQQLPGKFYKSIKVNGIW